MRKTLGAKSRVQLEKVASTLSKTKSSKGSKGSAEREKNGDDEQSTVHSIISAQDTTHHEGAESANRAGLTQTASMMDVHSANGHLMVASDTEFDGSITPKNP